MRFDVRSLMFEVSPEQTQRVEEFEAGMRNPEPGTSTACSLKYPIQAFSGKRKCDKLKCYFQTIKVVYPTGPGMVPVGRGKS